MDSQQQNYAMVLYIPYTIGDNDGRKGVTEQQVFLHMRNLNLGSIDHIDCQERTDRWNGTHIRTWFVYFSTWTADDKVTEKLNDGDYIKIERRDLERGSIYDYEHYWKLFKLFNETKKDVTAALDIAKVSTSAFDMPDLEDYQTDEEEEYWGWGPAPKKSVFDNPTNEEEDLGTKMALHGGCWYYPAPKNSVFDDYIP